MTFPALQVERVLWTVDQAAERSLVHETGFSDLVYRAADIGIQASSGLRAALRRGLVPLVLGLEFGQLAILLVLVLLRWQEDELRERHVGNGEGLEVLDSMPGRLIF